jgi:sn-glycerol 3-phosphate transport system ATP-binding protein
MGAAQKTLSSDSPSGGKALALSGIGKRFGDTTALDGITLTLEAGKFSVLLGPSGCGKSTLLRIIAGLEAPSAGQIWLGPDRIDALPPKARDLSMVFQSYALFPHLNVAENILFGLSVRRTPKAEQTARLNAVASMMGLENLLARKPAHLSGGQQQRVALARAVISERPICLMDEPLSNLDAKLRAEMRSEIRALQQRLGLTMVYVTHDQVEAMTMADQIVVMNAGRIEQVATPRALYSQPATTFVAGFIGTPPMNLLPRHALPDIRAPHGTATIGVRPEDMCLTGPGYRLRARVLNVEYLGADQIVTLALNDAGVALRLNGHMMEFDDVQALTLPLQALHFFDAAGHRLATPADPTQSLDTENRDETLA